VVTARWPRWRARYQPEARQERLVGRSAVVDRVLQLESGRVWKTGRVLQRGMRWLGGGLLILAFLGGCQTRFETAISPESGIGVFLAADKRLYNQGETIEVTFGVLNRSAEPLTLRFRTAQRYDLLVQDARGQEVWRWSTDQFFAQALGEETLPAREGALTYRVSVRHPLAAGRYTVVGIIPAAEARMSASMEIEVR